MAAQMDVPPVQFWLWQAAHHDPSDGTVANPACGGALTLRRVSRLRMSFLRTVLVMVAPG
jgi:hypothetical protein